MGEHMRVLRFLILAVTAVSISCGDAAGPDTPLAVDHVELSQTSLTLAPNGSQTLTATPRAASGAVVPGRSITWSSDNEAVATVTGIGQVGGVSLGTGTITASVDGKSASATITVIPTLPGHLAAKWRMVSFDGHVLPAAYAIFYDEPVGDRIIAKLEIRLDSAIKTMANNGVYERRYYFTELHDDAPMLRYLWGDHGRFVLGAASPVPLTLTSEYIENLVTTGHVRSDGRLALSEELWLGEARRATVWARAGQ